MRAITPVRPAAPEVPPGAPDAAPLRGVERVVAWCLPSLADLLFVCALLGGLLVLQGRVLGLDGDVGWGIRLGVLTLRHGLPRAEPLLGPVLGRPLVDWEWLAQVAYAAAYLLGGLNGVVALAALLMGLTAVLLMAALRRHGLPALPALALALIGLALLTMDWTARANLFSLPLTLWWSERIWRYWRDGRRRHLLLLPPAMALWANLHGGFIAGLLLLGSAWLVAWAFPRRRGQARPRALALTLLASCAAMLLTPWGMGLPLHLIAFARDPLVAAHTQEFQSPDFHLWYGWLFLALLAALLAAWAWRLRAGRVPEPLAITWLALWTVLTLYSVRFLPLWLLICLPLLADALVAAWRERPAGAPFGPRVARLGAWARPRARRVEAMDAQVVRGVWSALALAFVLALLLGGGRLPGAKTPLLDARFDAQAFPVAAVARLRVVGLPAGQGFNPYSWGGYLDYALPADHPFIDSRSDVYGERLLADYVSIEQVAPGWQRLLAAYAVRWALLPAGTPLAQVLALTPGWRCAAADGQGVAVLCVAQKLVAPAR